MALFLLCIHSEAGAAGERLLESIRERFPKVAQEIYDDVTDFIGRVCLPTPAKEDEICIVLADNSDRLNQLVELKEGLEGRRLLLVLHEDDRECLSKCHLLRPRYVSYERERFSDLLAVLGKMIKACNGLSEK